MPDKPSAFDLFNSKAIDPDALDDAIRKGEEFQSRYGASGDWHGEVNPEALEKLRGRPKKTLSGQVGEAVFSEEGPVRQWIGRTFTPGPGPLMPGDEGPEEYDRRISKNRRELAVRKREYWQGRSKELDEALVGSKGKATRMERIGKWAAETVESEALHSEYGFEQPGIADRLGQAGMSMTRGFMHGAVAGNLKGGALAYSYLHDIFSEEEGGPAEGYEAYKLGAFVAEKAEEMTDPRLKNEYLANTLPEGFGSMLAFWAGARGGASIFQAAKARQLAAGTAVLAQGSALESSALYEDALNSGASERVAKMAAPWGIPLGATELLGAGRILMKWDKTTGGAFKHTLKEYWKHSARGGMEEGLQEFFQTEGHEAIAVMIYRDHRRPIEESLEAGVTGGILGAMMGGIAANPSVKILRRKHAAQKFFDSDNDAAVRLASIEGNVSRSVFEEITGIEGTSVEYRNDFQGDVKEAIAGEILDIVDAETEKQIAEIKAKADAEAAAEVTDPILAALRDIAKPETDLSAPVEEVTEDEVAQPTPLEEVEDQPPPTVEQVVEQPAEAPAAVVEPEAVTPAEVVAEPPPLPAEAAVPAEVAPAEVVAPAEPVTQQISPDVPTVQQGDAGATVTVDELRVAELKAELKAEGKSTEAAEKRAAAEAVAPPEVLEGTEVVEKGVSQADAHVFGQSNTVVTSEEMANAIELLKQKGLGIGRGEKPTAGGVSAIDADMLKAIGKIGMYYAEALARANIKFTKTLFRKYLRNFAPFSQKTKSGYLVSNKELDKAIKEVMEGPPTVDRRNIEYKNAFDEVAKTVRKKTIINSIIRWNEGETIETAAQKLLDWSMKRQEVSADKAYRASVIDENESWEFIIGYAREVLPPEMHNRIARILETMARGRVRTQKGRKDGGRPSYEEGRDKAREKVIQAINNLIEQYERAAAIKGLKELIAKSGVLSKDNNLRPETRDAIEGLIEDIIFQQPTAATLKRLESLSEAADFDTDNEIHQLPIRLVERAGRILGEQAAKGYGVRSLHEDIEVSAHDVVPRLSAEEIRQLTETIGQLLHQMKTKNLALARRKNMTLQQVKDEVRQNIADRYDANRSLEPGQGDDIRGMDILKRALYFEHLSLDSIAHILGGRESAVYYIFSESLRRARDGVASIQLRAQDDIRAVLEEQGITGSALTEWSEMGSQDRGMFVTIIKAIRGQKQAERIVTPLAPYRQEVVFDDRPSRVVEANSRRTALAALTEEERDHVTHTRPRPTATDSESGKRVPHLILTRAERISLYLHLQDRDTRSEILSNKSKGIAIHSQLRPTGGGIKLTIDDMLAFEGSMTKEELAVANAISKVFNGWLRELVNASWLEHHGTEIANLENYFPRSRDPSYFDKDVQTSSGDWLDSHLDSQGILRSRSQGVVAPIMVFDAFSAYYAHVNRTASFIAKHGPLSDAFSVLRSKEFRDSLLKNHKNGTTILDYLKKTLTEFQGLEVRKESSTWVNTIVRSIIRGSHISALGLKPQIAMYQTASIAAASTAISLKYLGPAGLTSLSPDLIAEIKEWSGTLRHRLESGGHQILSPGYQGSALMEFFGATHRDYGGSTRESIDRVSMAMIKKGDTTVIATIWGAVKLEAKEKGLVEGTEEFKTYVSNRTVDIVDQTQPTWDVLTSSKMQNAARHNALLKLAVMFSSQRNKNFNMVMRDVSDYSSSKTKATSVEGLSEARRLAGKLFTVLGIQSAMVFYSGKSMWFLLAWLYGDDDELDKYADDTWYEDILAIGQKSLGNWLIIGDAVNRLIDVLREDSSMPPSYRRNRGTILVGINRDFWDGLHFLKEGTTQWIEDERYTGLGPKAGRKKATDTLSKALDKLVSSTGMMTGLPTGAARQMFGRLMPHRRPVKWKYEPVNQLNDIEREYRRAGQEISKAEEKLDRTPADPELRAIIEKAKKVRRDNYIAHRIWTYAESDILENLAEAKRGLKVDETAVVMERTRLEALADAYQKYAKDDDVSGMVKVADPAFQGKLVMDYTTLDPKFDPLKSRTNREKTIAENVEKRKSVEPFVSKMRYEDALNALKWGYWSANADRANLNIRATGVYTTQHGGQTDKNFARIVDMKTPEVIGILMSGEGETSTPIGKGYTDRLIKLQESFGNR